MYSRPSRKAVLGTGKKKSMLRTHANCKFLSLQRTMRKPMAQTLGKIQKQGDVGLFHQHLNFLQADDT